MDSPAASDWPTLLTSTFPVVGVPLPASQALAPAAFRARTRARTRTRYSVALSSPLISAVAPVPLCGAATQPEARRGRPGPSARPRPSATVTASAEV